MTHGGQVRLTRRGRLVLVLLLVVLAFTATSVLRTASQAATGPARAATRYITVRPGQTLWQIALTVAPDGNPSDTVDDLRDLNGLGVAPVQAGQQLIVPR
jgi:predicted Zn-dependent protease